MKAARSTIGIGRQIVAVLLSHQTSKMVLSSVRMMKTSFDGGAGHSMGSVVCI